MAQLYARALGIAFSEGVEAFFNYELRDLDRNPSDQESFFGMVHGNFAPKPAYSAYWTFIDRRPAGSAQKPGVWRDERHIRYFPQWTRPDGRDAGMVWTTGAPEARRQEVPRAAFGVAGLLHGRRAAVTRPPAKRMPHRQ